jgi:hypothetical protein
MCCTTRCTNLDIKVDVNEKIWGLEVAVENGRAANVE